MRGVRKVKGRNLYEACYQNKKIGRLRKSFKTEKEAINQRKEWESEYGEAKPGVEKGTIKIDRRGQRIKNFIIIDYLPDSNEKVLVKNKLTEELSVMSLHGIVHGQSTGVPLNIANFLSKGDDQLGVRYRKDINKWSAHISVKNEYVSLGVFNTKQEAINARLAAEEKYFKPILEKNNKQKGDY